MKFTLTTPFAGPPLNVAPPERAVVVITTEMPRTDAQPTVNQIVFNQEIFGGVPMEVELLGNQVLSITRFTP